MCFRICVLFFVLVGVSGQVWGASGEVWGASGEVLPLVLTLEEAQQIAVEDNPNLKAAEARVEQADAVLRQARSSYFPTVSSSVTASVTKLSDDDFDAAKAGAFFTGSTADDTAESYRGNVTIAYLVFDGYGRKFRTASAKFGTLRSSAAHLESKRLLLNAVALAFHNVQLSRESINISIADEAFNSRQLNEAQRRHEVGTGSLSDTLNFEIRIRSARSSLLESERSHSLALIALTRLMGVTHDRVPEGLDVAPLVAERDEEMALPDETEWIAYSLAHRPDLLELEHVVAQTDANVKVSRSTFYPSLVASASADAFRRDNAFFEDDNTSKTLGLQLQYDIFTGGFRKARLHESKAVAREFERVLDGQEIAVTAEVREAIQQLETSQKLLVLQDETTVFVEENRQLVEKEYNAGQGSLVRLNQAQRDLISQQASYAFARVSLRQAWVNLHTATGAILE